MQPLAPHLLYRRFPAGIDAQLLPQARQRAQPMAVQPFAQRHIVFAVGLDLAQRGELRFRGRMFALAVAQRLGAGCPAFLQQGAFGLKCLEGRLRLRQRRLAFRDTGFEFAHRGIRCLHGL